MKHNAFKGRRKFCPLFERIGERKRVLYYQKEDLAPRHRMDGKTRERERERASECERTGRYNRLGFSCINYLLIHYQLSSNTVNDYLKSY